MKYLIMEEDEFLLIKISGKTKNNEAALSNARLKPHLQDKGVKVIIDLKELEKFEPMILLSILNSIKKEMSNGCNNFFYPCGYRFFGSYLFEFSNQD